MKIVMLAGSLASLVVLVVAAYQENFLGQWRSLQSDYAELLWETAPSEAARQAAMTFAVEHKQIFLPELEAIDRCTTCHLGVENPAMSDTDQPFRQHPGELLVQHPAEKFGCTICHGGQGRAVSKEAAHGWDEDGQPVAHIEGPMLRGVAIYTSCGQCHTELDAFGGSADLYAAGTSAGDGPRSRVPITDATLDLSLPGADLLTEGKRLFVESGCLGCHQYRDRGGNLGPDLTYVGDKTVHDFDFAHVKGERTVEQWLYEHFMVPGEVSPGTTMPDMGLTPDQGRALSLYMMSLHRKSAPASHMPPPAQAQLAAARPVSGEVLYGMFCASCHGADGHGTTMRTGLWPLDADPWGHQWDDRRVVIETRNEMEVLVPSLHHADTLGTVSDDYLRYIIANGRPGTNMLAWAKQGGLNAGEVEALVDYLRSWQRPAPDLVDASASRGDSRMGAALYRANCAACHGRDGAGGIGNTLNSPTFLAVASDEFLRQTIAQGRPNTAMPAWREFDSQEISDLLAYMRQWQPERGTRDGVLTLLTGEETPQASATIGQVLYDANCVMCHGADGAGDLGPSLNTQAFLTVVDDPYLVDTLIEGRPGTGMPSWRHLSSRDVASIVRYIRTWQTEPGKSADWHAQVVPQGDWDAGHSLFVGVCAGCHGAEGQGATGPQLNNPVFLRTTTDVMLREWITHGKEGTEMRGFRKGGQGITELTDRQIEDIVSHLRRLERLADSGGRLVAKSPHGRPELGAALYVNNCAGCHGDRGEGSSGPALSNPNFLKYASDGFLMATMALGRSGTEMRPVKRGPQSILGLTSDEVNNLVAYLRSWEHDPPYTEPTDLPHRFVVPWDLARGRDLFVSHCAGCHGEEGKGMWAPELNNEGFLAAATDGFLQATIIRGRHGTAMRAFGPGRQGLADLTERDIDDIVAYIRQWSIQTPSPMTMPAERSLEHPAAPLGEPTASLQPTARHGAVKRVDVKRDPRARGHFAPVAAVIPTAEGD